MFNYEEWKKAVVITFAYLLLGPYCIFMMLIYPFKVIWKWING